MSEDPTTKGVESRAIAIIGAGLTGLGYLKALLDLPNDARPDWTIDCFEKRTSVGGIWHPQPQAPEPPFEPETPMYDNFQTVTLSTGITFPNRPLPHSTPLFCGDGVIDEYIHDFVRDYHLGKFIHLGHAVTSLSLSDSQNRRPWTVDVQRTDPISGVRSTFSKTYSTVVIAIGVTPTARIVQWTGQDAWLKASTDRKILHSMWYRRPDIAKDRFVVVIGYHPSGAHVAKAVSEVAREVYHIFLPDPLTANFPKIRGTKYHPITSKIARLSATAIHLENESVIQTPADTIIIQCTGYKRTYPFLIDELETVSSFDWDNPQYPLESNERYIRPLYKHMVPVSRRVPLGSLVFGCLFPIIWNLPTSYAQGLWLGHVLANQDVRKEMLPSREMAFQEVRDFERRQRKLGMDGSRSLYILLPLGKATDDYADSLIEEIRAKSAFSLPAYLEEGIGRPFTEEWRRRAFQITLPLINAWEAAKESGVAESFSQGARTEDDYAKATEDLWDWWQARRQELSVS